jgi:formyltetrahydrofolate deformylase
LIGGGVSDFVLTLSCPDRPGIVHAVSGYLVEHGANIVESQQFGDRLTSRFFMRIAFTTAAPTDPAPLREAFADTARRFGMHFGLWAADAPYRTLVMVSKHLHCLNDLLFRASTGAVQIEIPAVVSNHPDAGPLVRSYGIDFHHVPVTSATKSDAEEQLMEIVDSTGSHLVVLARYMQVLSDNVSKRLYGKIINIHHSFLPSFKGAKPYHQAYERGVKLIGATAHYVTADLDEGPIIEQETERVTHAMNADDFVAAGRDIESRVLARAVKYHVDARVMLNGHKTVVF